MFVRDVHICMYVYKHVGTCVNADACTCGGPRLRSGNIFHHSSALLIEARPLSHSQSSQICLLSPSQAEQLVGCQSHWLYYEFCGFELWSSCLQNKHLTTKPCFQLLGVPLLERNYFQYLVSMTTLKSFQNQDRTLNCFYGLSEESTQLAQEFYICL